MNKKGEVSRGTIDQIRRAHKSATPKLSVNPAWANTHHDLGVCLEYIEKLEQQLSKGEDRDD